MNLEMLQSFDIPAHALESMTKSGYKIVEMDDGVSRMSGHDNGVAYKFINLQIRNHIKSEAVGFDVPDTIEHIQWFVDRRTKPIERVSELPPALLRFNKLGECVGGRYKDAYLRFKQGQNAEGLQLSRWPEASDSDVFSLTSAGVFTVEQLAEMKRDRVHDLFGGYFDELWQKAVTFTSRVHENGKTEELAGTILELQKQIAEMQAQLSAKAEASAEADISQIVDKAEKAIKKKGTK